MFLHRTDIYTSYPRTNFNHDMMTLRLIANDIVCRRLLH